MSGRGPPRLPRGPRKSPGFPTVSVLRICKTCCSNTNVPRRDRHGWVLDSVPQEEQIPNASFCSRHPAGSNCAVTNAAPTGCLTTADTWFGPRTQSKVCPRFCPRWQTSRTSARPTPRRHTILSETRHVTLCTMPRFRWSGIRPKGKRHPPGTDPGHSAVCRHPYCSWHSPG